MATATKSTRPGTNYKPVGQTWIIEGSKDGRLVYPKVGILSVFTGDVGETYVYDVNDNRDIKLKFWKAMARIKGIDPETISIQEV